MEGETSFGSVIDVGGEAHRTLIVAELSASHGGDFQRALQLVDLAAEVGADLVKIQTYRPDTITIDCDRDHFVRQGTIWEGRRLYDLYEEAHTPWEWHEALFERAERAGLPMFSTPFDASAVELLESLEVPAYKVGSFELVDMPLLERIGATQKPVVLSTGMASLAEIEEALQAIRKVGGGPVALMKTTSAYPSPDHEMNLNTIPHLADTFDVSVGLSDHTIGSCVPVAAVAKGAKLVEKHLCVSRSIDTPDSAFASEPDEFARMVDEIRRVENALGDIHYGPTDEQMASVDNRRSLFIVRDVSAGDELTEDNLRSIRPGFGLHPRYYRRLLGARVTRDVRRGTPMSWELVLDGG